MRVVQAVQKGRDLRHCIIHRASGFDVFPHLLHARSPVNTVELRIVVMLLHVCICISQHGLSEFTIRLCVLLGPSGNWRETAQSREKAKAFPHHKKVCRSLLQGRWLLQNSGYTHRPVVLDARPRLPKLIPSFPHAIVTSNLDPRFQRANHGQGGGTCKNRGAVPNSFVVKILTPKPLGLKILQTLFADPAPSKPFRGRGGGGRGNQPLTSISF